MTSSILQHLKPGNAICYSGYRRGQSPDTQVFPSLDEIREDLHLLQKNWRYLRLYDCTLHAERVLQVITEDRLDFQDRTTIKFAALLAGVMGGFVRPKGF